jgi:hypothetical protein
VKRPPGSEGVPPKGVKPSTVSRTGRRSTIPRDHPPRRVALPRPSIRPAVPKLSLRAPKRLPVQRRDIGLIIDEESTVLDLLDNLLNKGVMLNAELILALANVDLVYVRLSALLCAADRVLPSSPRLRQGYVGQAPPKR